MTRFLLILLGLVLVGLLGAGVVLATLDLPPPAQPVDRVVPNERFAPR